MELISDKIKIKDILEWKKGNILRVNPEYQRGAVWKEAQQKKLVDSVMRGYPLPLIYLHHKKQTIGGISREDFEIIDGQQRINALYYFGEGAIKLFDPVKDDKEARFPQFIKDMSCPWASCEYYTLPEDLRKKFDETEIFIVKITTHNEDEARDLFIRLQAGLPLNAQEKRDAWPGGFTEFVLKYGGKKELVRYPGHDFFRKVVLNPSSDRGEIRTLCAQIAMLFLQEAAKGNWMNIGTKQVDDYYYQNLGFDIFSDKVMRFGKVLHLAVDLFNGYKGPKLKVHEAIHVVLLLDSLIDEYTASWQKNFIPAFDSFRHKSAVDKKAKDGEYWLKYGALTMTQAAGASTIQARHDFFSRKMLEDLQPVKKDSNRIYGLLEREILYFQYRKQCVVCEEEISWEDLEIHHVDEHHHGGQTTLENGVPVHKKCHPKGPAAISFNIKWKDEKEKVLTNKNSFTARDFAADENTFSSNVIKYKIENNKKGVLAIAVTNENGKLVVLKGSTIAAQVSESFDVNAAAPSVRRKKLIEDGIIDQNFTFTRDVIFNSKSNAASLVLGHSANGNFSWVPIRDE
jgi:hypothetical protein